MLNVILLMKNIWNSLCVPLLSQYCTAKRSINAVQDQCLLLFCFRLCTISCLCGSTVGSVWRHTLMSWHLLTQQCLCTRQQTGMRERWVPAYLGAGSLWRGAVFSWLNWFPGPWERKKCFPGCLSRVGDKRVICFWMSFCISFAGTAQSQACNWNFMNIIHEGLVFFFSNLMQLAWLPFI